MLNYKEFMEALKTDNLFTDRLEILTVWGGLTDEGTDIGYGIGDSFI